MKGRAGSLLLVGCVGICLDTAYGLESHPGPVLRPNPLITASVNSPNAPESEAWRVVGSGADAWAHAEQPLADDVIRRPASQFGLADTTRWDGDRPPTASYPTLLVARGVRADSDAPADLIAACIDVALIPPRPDEPAERTDPACDRVLKMQAATKRKCYEGDADACALDAKRTELMIQRTLQKALEPIPR